MAIMGRAQFFGITCGCGAAVPHWGAWMDHKIDTRCKQGVPTTWWIKDGQVVAWS